MEVTHRVERALERHLDGRTHPPRLGAAMRHAVFPGGARVRPSLAIHVAHACGDDRPAVSDALAAAVEYLHCASLAHDDLPCFDDAASRRGRPSVHAEHGEPLAVLAGDGLIVLAFQSLGDVAEAAAERLPGLLRIVAECAGSPNGLTAGQAFECEPASLLAPYHAAKTGALFEAAAAGGAAAAGAPVDAWRTLGARLGRAYQIADDIHDRAGADQTLGKPVGQDSRLGRPNAVDEHGLMGAVKELRRLISEAADMVPERPETDALRTLIAKQTERFLPKTLTVAA